MGNENFRDRISKICTTGDAVACRRLRANNGCPEVIVVNRRGC